MKKHSSVLMTLLLFALSTVMYSQQTAMNSEAGKLYNEGNKLVKSGQYEGALAKYDEALTIDQHPNIYYQKSIALKKLRKFNYAEAALKKCIEADPNFVSAYSGLGTTYYSLKKYQEAINNFEKYIELSNNEKQNKKIKKFIGLSYTQLGQAEKRDGKHEKAIVYLKEAVNNYNYDAAYLTLAEIYVELGNYDKSLTAADNAINYRTSKSKISKGAPYYYKGLAFKGKDEVDKAKENFQIASKDKQYKSSSEYELKNLK